MSHEPEEPLKAVVLNVRVRPETRALIDDLRERHGVPNVELVARLFDWFAAQPRSVRQEFLDRDGDPAAELVRLKVAEMGNSSSGGGGGGSAAGSLPLTVDQAAAAIRALADQIEQIEAARRREFGPAAAGGGETSEDQRRKGRRGKSSSSSS